MQQQQPQGPPIDLKNTEAILNEDGGPLFLQGVIMRKVSKFITGTAEDGIMPITVIYDPKTLKIYEGSLPPDLRDEYKELYKEEGDDE